MSELELIDAKIRETENYMKEWGKVVNKKLVDLELNKRQFAKILGLNENTAYSVIGGYVSYPEHRQKIITKIHELEAQQAAKHSAGGVAV